MDKNTILEPAIAFPLEMSSLHIATGAFILFLAKVYQLLEQIA